MSRNIKSYTDTEVDTFNLLYTVYSMQWTQYINCEDKIK